VDKAECANSEYGLILQSLLFAVYVQRQAFCACSVFLLANYYFNKQLRSPYVAFTGRFL
jgi:hypothetical protein